MNTRLVAWIFRLFGFALLVAAGVAWFEQKTIGDWMGEREWLGLYPNEWFQYGMIAVTAFSIRLLVFGLSVGLRFGLSFVAFMGLCAFAFSLPRIVGDNSPYAGEAVGWVLMLFSLPAGIASIVLAAIPFFDNRFRSARDPAVAQTLGNRTC